MGVSLCVSLPARPVWPVVPVAPHWPLPSPPTPPSESLSSSVVPQCVPSVVSLESEVSIVTTFNNS